MRPKDVLLVLKQFDISIQNVSFKSIHQGLINDTFLISDNGSPLYILQQINTHVFKDYIGLHQNLELALQQLHAEDYQSIKIIKNRDNQPYSIYNGEVWRLQSYVTNSIAHDFATNAKIAFESGRILGRFHGLLKNENLNDYKTTIPNFNHLPYRVKEFETALISAKKTRLISAKNEIHFAQQLIPKLLTFYNLNLPLRLCHNDTKLNNFLFSKTDKALCLIDLDTVMPGYFHYDFGDAVRTIVSESIEGELNRSKINFNSNYFEAFIKGLKASHLQLSKNEIAQLPLAISLMPFMHGLRALTAYLNGNIYYKVAYDSQNLERCTSLFYVADLGVIHSDTTKTIIATYLL
ncbi:MAG: aminoglycoside phosphotransferase family protein [Flavobacteriaceae bacterium]|nr:aminoglycoside phosphotransferase family protein [Flavobacteriaceae bacterium]